MRLLCISDLHGSREALERILARAAPAEMVLLGGDLTHLGSPEDAEQIVRQARASGATVRAVAGNCDSAEIERRLAQLGVSLHGRGELFGTVGLHGLSGMPPWRSHMYQFGEDELAGLLRAGHAQIAGAARHLVLSHAPPYRSKLDRTHFFKHVGSRALRAFIDRVQPLLVVCGHIHEGRGVERLGRTTLVNCGMAGRGYYAVAEVAEVDEHVEVDLRRT